MILARQLCRLFVWGIIVFRERERRLGGSAGLHFLDKCLLLCHQAVNGLLVVFSGLLKVFNIFVA